MGIWGEGEREGRRGLRARLPFAWQLGDLLLVTLQRFPSEGGGGAHDPGVLDFLHLGGDVMAASPKVWGVGGTAFA